VRHLPTARLTLQPRSKFLMNNKHTSTRGEGGGMGVGIWRRGRGKGGEGKIMVEGWHKSMKGKKY
jgi:hypothetical protein